jgi:hypothetical protein
MAKRTHRVAWGLMALVAVGLLGSRGSSRHLVQGWQRPIELSTIDRRSQSVVIDFQSTGCFHFAHYQLRYEPAPTPRLVVTDRNPRSAASPGAERAGIPSQEQVGVVELTREQVARLDNLLRFYRRQVGEGGCTTSDTISVVLYQNGHLLRREEFVDSTCQSHLLADADPRDLAELRMSGGPALSLRDLIAAATEAKKRGVARVHYHSPPREQTSAYHEVLVRKESTREAGLAQQMVRDLKGYPALGREFRVQQVMLGNINLLPYSLHPTLVAIQPRVVDSAWWFNPVVKDHPQYDWNQFLAVHREVERAAIRHPWISAWKKLAPGRSAEAHIYGVTPTEETDLATFVTPAWKHAGLKGAPYYELLLRRDDNTWAQFFFGRHGARARIAHAGPTNPGERANRGHWLDSMTVLYHPTQEIPDYVVVRPNGTWIRNTRPKTDGQGRQTAATRQIRPS